MYCPQCSPMLPTCCYLRSNKSRRYTIRLGLGSFEWCSANLPTDNFRADHVPFHFCIRAQFDVLEIDHYPTIPEDFIRIFHPMVRYDLHKSKIKWMYSLYKPGPLASKYPSYPTSNSQCRRLTHPITFLIQLPHNPSQAFQPIWPRMPLHWRRSHLMQLSRPRFTQENLILNI